ncbi:MULTISPECIES: DUF397 domain-containing protein [unclassified Streptomyces]|uniref:DUF397 domain-containing protein n=1 Tax=unclassified Streptomyces TaxID=2593676 RepID=UPI0035E17C54
MTRAAHPDPRTATLDWFKSSYSASEGGNCVEVAYDWRTSSYSSSQGGDCVEVSAHPAAVHIRDSKVADGPVLTVPPAAWAAFLGATA